MFNYYVAYSYKLLNYGLLIKFKHIFFSSLKNGPPY